uniref:tRNA(Ile)-lysidine synthase-like n=1 Tax=Erigeron canadensis TaxID=72917 RepID=UPI001CB95EED|nr:tRNA(Ile)-lysidine synthase-like [Erigeron canadensis]
MRMAKSQLIPTGLSSSLHILTKFHSFFTSTRTNYVRLLCSCSYNYNQQTLELDKYKETFSKRMAMAGLQQHHRIAVGVSGGPDSMALCLLAADWKTNGLNATSRGKNDVVDGLLAIIVDHGLRAESKDEAEMVQCRVLDMGIRCEIAHCKWTDGRPKLGHLQEAARDMRYERLQDICSQHQIGVLLIAHHADDQAELFILRLSRNSGVLGLAGMALTTQLFAANTSFNGTSNSILIVRPLLDFSKQDLYKICEGAKQEWVEDPTNHKTIFARNRIRLSLQNLSSSIFKSELQAIILACRRTRFYVDQVSQTLISQAVTVMPQGYAIIDLLVLNPSEVSDICLSKFVTLLLQFISQRQRPVRGRAQKLLLNYFRAFPCKSSFTAAGCYLCAAPGSKGTKVLICCSVNSALPMKMQSFYVGSSNEPKVNISSELEQVIETGRSYSNKKVLNALEVPFLNTTSVDSILTEAKRLKILSEPTCQAICSLHETELEKFKLKPEALPDHESPKVVESVEAKDLRHGQIGHFMDRFSVSWELIYRRCDSCCGLDQDSVTEVRHMVDADWLYLSKLNKSEHMEGIQLERVNAVRESAHQALLLLKSIPVAARRSLPVLVNPKGQILSIPSVCFSICQCLKASAEFIPRVPLGGGYSSFL